MIFAQCRKVRMALCMAGAAVASSFSPYTAFSQGIPSGEKQKIAEGQYVRLKDNLRVEGSEQNWILWRLPDGSFELEDHFLKDPDAAAFLLLQIPLAMPSGVSSELRKQLKEIVYRTALVVRFDPGFRPTDLTVTGKKFPRGGFAEATKCRVDTQIVRCQSTGHDTKLPLGDSGEFFYSFPFPMLFTGWLRAASVAPAELMTRNLVFFQYLGKPELTVAEARVQILDDEQITVGDHQFRTHKAQVTFAMKSSPPRLFTVWYGKAGQVFATQSASEGDERLALVQYKKYSDF